MQACLLQHHVCLLWCVSTPRTPPSQPPKTPQKQYSSQPCSRSGNISNLGLIGSEPPPEQGSQQSCAAVREILLMVQNFIKLGTSTQDTYLLGNVVETLSGRHHHHQQQPDPHHHHDHQHLRPYGTAWLHCQDKPRG